jgi:hypothetical protein
MILSEIMINVINAYEYDVHKAKMLIDQKRELGLQFNWGNAQCALWDKGSCTHHMMLTEVGGPSRRCFS